MITQWRLKPAFEVVRYCSERSLWIGLFLLVLIARTVFPSAPAVSANFLPPVHSGDAAGAALAAGVTRETPEPDEEVSYELPDQERLCQYMLDLINQARADADLAPVSMNALATSVAQQHAEEMAANNYLSHWDLAGLGPDMRYNAAGGSYKSQENVYSFHRTYQGNPLPLSDWEQEVKKAFDYLFSSYLHRSNILNPEHTHVGIGLAYDEASGEFRAVQMFLNRYLELDNASHTARPGERVTITGRLLQDADEVLINLDYETFPVGKSLEELRQTVPYASRAGNVDYMYVTVNADHSFQVNVPLRDWEGLYHVRIWLTVDGNQFLATDHIIWSAEP